VDGHANNYELQQRRMEAVAASWAACRSPMRGRSDGGEDAVANRIPDATGTADLIDVIVAPDAGHVCCPEPRSRVLPS
jgi:hypothetical protein